MKKWGELFYFNFNASDWYDGQRDFSILKGKTITGIMLGEDLDGGDRLVFRCSDGSTLFMWHEQDCCESVSLEDIAGDMNDLIGSEIKQAEESTNEAQSDCGDSQTWTFYKIGTLKGYVTLRWYGTSNGYYSESVYTVWQ